MSRNFLVDYADSRAHLSLEQQRRILVPPAGVRHYEEPVVLIFRDDEIVENSALIIGENRESGAALLEILQIGGCERLEELAGVAASHTALQHVADVKDRGVGASVLMRRRNCFPILDGQQPAGEVDDFACVVCFNGLLLTVLLFPYIQVTIFNILMQ